MEMASGPQFPATSGPRDGFACSPLSGGKTPSVLLNHHLGSLDDGRHGVPLLEVQLVGAPTRDCTLNQVFADTHDHMSHDSAKHDFLNRTFESVSR
jgi:hypothetical protein